jgi:hypothetical protein
MLDMKVIKIKNLNQNAKYSWLLTGSYHQHLAIWKKDLRNLANLDHFFHEKPF